MTEQEIEELYAPDQSNKVQKEVHTYRSAY